MHLYVHVPFCARRCSYCDFAIAVRRSVPSDAYADAVLAEWRGRIGAEPWAADEVLDTIYFGGGTPSHLDPSAIGRILTEVRRDRVAAPAAEVTLEANPDDVTAERAHQWRAAGVNRISLGVQSFDPAVLQWMHRTHTVEQVSAAVAALRGAGLTELSLDLIFGVPASLDRNWRRDLDQALALEPPHLSVYGLTVEAGTPLGRWVHRGEVRPVDEDRYATEFLEADALLAAAGYHHYEVSSYGRAGHRALHNSAYWGRAAYLGIGPSAHSGAGDRRWWNTRDWVPYQRALSAGEPTIAGTERLDSAAVAVEELYLGLRTDKGVPADAVAAEVRGRWIERDWAAQSGGMLRLTAEGWLRLDGLVDEALTARPVG